MQAAVQRSRAARMQATAQRRYAPLEVMMLLTMTMGQAPRQAQKLRSSRQPRAEQRRKSTASERLRAAAREAQSTHSKAQRASALAQKRSLATGATPTATAAAPERKTRAACADTAVHRRHEQAEKPAVQALCVQHGSHGALKRVSKQSKYAQGKVTDTSKKLLAAAIEAHLMQSSLSSLKLGLATESSSSADQSGQASDGPCSSSQGTQQQGSLQVIWCPQPALSHCGCLVLDSIGSNQHFALLLAGHVAAAQAVASQTRAGSGCIALQTMHSLIRADSISFIAQSLGSLALASTCQ